MCIVSLKRDYTKQKEFILLLFSLYYLLEICIGVSNLCVRSIREESLPKSIDDETTQNNTTKTPELQIFASRTVYKDHFDPSRLYLSFCLFCFNPLKHFTNVDSNLYLL